MQIVTKDHFYSRIVYDLDNEDEVREFNKIYRYFSIKDPKKSYSARVRSGESEGKIRFVRKNGTFLSGLINKIKTYMKNEEIEFSDDTISNRVEFDDKVDDFVVSLNLPYEPYYFQIDGLKIALKNKRKIVLSATGSGKSLLLFMIINYLLKEDEDEMIVLVVPDVGLVNQMYNDFKEYASYRTDFDEVEFERIYHKIFSGQEKDTKHRVKISTWQSIYDMEESHPIFTKTSTILSDECHLCSAESYMTIFEKSINCKKRIGVSGTMPPTLIEALKLEGIFATAVRVVSSRELMDLGLATESIVQPIYLRYNQEDITDLRRRNTNKELSKAEKGYLYEMKFIKEHDIRLKVLVKFMLSIAKRNDGNLIVLFKNIEYGDKLYEEMKKHHENTFIIKGKVSGVKREEIRQNMVHFKNAVLFGTDKIVSTGLNIPSLKYMMLAQNGKSEIKIIQGLGRLMRLLEGKDESILYDIIDDLVYTSKPTQANPKGNDYPNYSWQWHIDRLESYEKYEFTINKPKRLKLPNSSLM